MLFISPCSDIMTIFYVLDDKNKRYLLQRFILGTIDFTTFKREKVTLLKSQSSFLYKYQANSYGIKC